MSTSQRAEDTGARPSIGPVALASALVLGILVGGGVAFMLRDPGGGTAAQGVSCPERTEVSVAVDPAIYSVVVSALSDLAPECASVQPRPVASGAVAAAYAEGGTLPDVWIAASPFWMREDFLTAARAAAEAAAEGAGAAETDVEEGDAQPATVDVDPRPVATTPVLLVGGPRAQEFSSWTAAQLSGTVRLPDPLSSTAGALALGASYAEARGLGMPTLPTRQVMVLLAQDHHERIAQGRDVSGDLAPITARNERLHVATEQELWTVSQDRPHLRSVTPPAAPLAEFTIGTASTASAESRDLAQDLAGWLRSDDGVAALRADGLRGADGTQLPEGAGRTAGEVLALGDVPAAEHAWRLQSWRALGTPSSILAVVDASGSMDSWAGDRSRMTLLSEAAGLGIRLLPGHARVGLWIFSLERGGPGQDWRVLLPTKRLDKLEFGRTQRFALRLRIGELAGLTEGGTGLYDTTLAAYRQAAKDYREGYANAVVLFSDGANDDPGSIELRDLTAQLRDLHDPARPVRIVAIGISAEADMAALHEIANATGGQAYEARDPRDIAEVFAKAILAR